MSHVSASRALKMANSAISANTIEEAKELLYEICFTALNARYAEMHEHQLIDIKTLDRLQESIKKGQVTPPPLAHSLSLSSGCVADTNAPLCFPGARAAA